MNKKICINCKHHVMVEGRVNCKCPSIVGTDQRSIKALPLREIVFDGDEALDAHGVPVGNQWCGPQARYYEEKLDNSLP